MIRAANANTALAFVLAAAVVLPACAQGFPAKPMRLILGFGPGGVTDVLNRLVADEVGRRLGQPMVVENRPGANALVAANAVRSSAADGYTFLGGSVTVFHPIFTKAGIDASKELAPVSTFAVGDWFLYVPGAIGVGSLKELAAYAKANPGKARFAAPASTNTLLFTVVAKRLDFAFENIPYKATDQTIAALLGGDGMATLNAASGFDPQIQAGKLRAISTLSPVRSAVRPEVPTAKEQGLDLEIRISQGLWGPAGLPADIVAKVGVAVREALRNAAVAERIRNAALVPSPSTPAEMLREFSNEIAFYREAIAISGYQPQ